MQPDVNLAVNVTMSSLFAANYRSAGLEMSGKTTDVQYSSDPTRA